jgi:3-methyladenine DNA glycosylase AlkD
VDPPTILARLKSLANPAAAAGMSRFGINAENTLGVSIPVLRTLAREIGRHHRLAEALWGSAIHEARILAAMVDDPRQVTEAQMDHWAADFDSWDVCDQVCSNLFDKTPFAFEKAITWSRRPKEFVKRAGFVLMAALAVHDKQAADDSFAPCLLRIQAEANDGRNFVKKAVNWALRQIGKRNLPLNAQAIATANQIGSLGTPAARWVAADALRELTSPAVKTRLDRSRKTRPAGSPTRKHKMPFREILDH